MSTEKGTYMGRPIGAGFDPRDNMPQAISSGSNSQPEIPEETVALENAVRDLYKVLNELIGRIAPVLKQDAPSPADPGKPVKDLCAMADMLCSNRIVVRNMETAVIDALRRLQL